MGLPLPELFLGAAPRPAVRAICRVFLLAAALAAFAPAVLPAQARGRPSVAAVESLLTSGSFESARAAATRLTRESPSDARSFDLLGAALLGGSPPRLLLAADAFREAVRLAPGDTVAWAGLADAGLRLGGADGEAMAREALERLLELNPAAVRAWDDWLKLYRSRVYRERMRRRLEPMASEPRVAVRLGQLLIEEERYAAADSVLDVVLAADSENAAALALRAQSAFEAGDAAAGVQYYESALRRARGDPEALWRQVVGIASPQELRAWAAGPADPERFLRAFWARRSANLFEPAASRVAEHFRRLRVARSRWALLHPLAGYQRLPRSRALNAGSSPGEEIFYQRCEARQFPGGRTSVADAARAFGLSGGALSSDAVPMPGVLSLDPQAFFGSSAMLGQFNGSVEDLDSAAATLGYSLRTGLDDRGLVYLRFGEPVRKMVGPPNAEDPFCAIPDLELWEYPDVGTVRFFRPSAVSVIGAGVSGRQTGDMVLRPMNDEQFETATEAMTRDATSVAAPLSFGAWFAQLRAADPRLTEVVVVTTRGAIAAELVPEDGAPGGVGESTNGVVALTSAAGRATLLVHARVGDSLGRQALPMRVRSFRRLAVSDLLIARPWGDTLVTRGAVLENLSRTLEFEVGANIRVAAEIYGLPASAGGQVGYRAVYQVVRSDDPARDLLRDSLTGATALAFERQRRSQGGVATEWLDVVTDPLPPGRYVLRLDLFVGDLRFGRAQASFRIVKRE